MAGDWIKMRSNLWDDPRVARLCDLTDCGEAQVIGALYWLWATADQHTEDGVMPGLTLRQIDRKTGVPGFGQALCDIGWLADHPEGVRLVRFTEHNGASAKRRCSEAQRKANVRAVSDSGRNVSASDADKPQTAVGQTAPETGRDAELEKEKEKEKKKTPSTPHGGVRFEDFWRAWPKSERKQDKAKCFDHWQRHELDELAEAVLADVATKCLTRKWQEGYVEAPLVYLRNRRWEDGVTPDVPAAAPTETPYQRAQRERMSEFASSLVSFNRTQSLEVVDVHAIPID